MSEALAVGHFWVVVFKLLKGDARGRKFMTEHNGAGLIPAKFRHHQQRFGKVAQPTSLATPTPSR
jgi:hypothetical protein